MSAKAQAATTTAATAATPSTARIDSAKLKTYFDSISAGNYQAAFDIIPPLEKVYPNHLLLLGYKAYAQYLAQHSEEDLLATLHKIQELGGPRDDQEWHVIRFVLKRTPYPYILSDLYEKSHLADPKNISRLKDYLYDLIRNHNWKKVQLNATKLYTMTKDGLFLIWGVAALCALSFQAFKLTVHGMVTNVPSDVTATSIQTTTTTTTNNTNSTTILYPQQNKVLSDILSTFKLLIQMLKREYIDNSLVAGLTPQQRVLRQQMQRQQHQTSKSDNIPPFAIDKLPSQFFQQYLAMFTQQGIVKSYLSNMKLIGSLQQFMNQQDAEKKQEQNQIDSNVAAPSNTTKKSDKFKDLCKVLYKDINNQIVVEKNLSLYGNMNKTQNNDEGYQIIAKTTPVATVSHEDVKYAIFDVLNDPQVVGDFSDKQSQPYLMYKLQCNITYLYTIITTLKVPASMLTGATQDSSSTEDKEDTKPDNVDVSITSPEQLRTIIFNYIQHDILRLCHIILQYWPDQWNIIAIFVYFQLLLESEGLLLLGDVYKKNSILKKACPEIVQQITNNNDNKNAIEYDTPALTNNDFVMNLSHHPFALESLTKESTFYTTFNFLLNTLFIDETKLSSLENTATPTTQTKEGDATPEQSSNQLSAIEKYQTIIEPAFTPKYLTPIVLDRVKAMLIGKWMAANSIAATPTSNNTNNDSTQSKEDAEREKLEQSLARFPSRGLLLALLEVDRLAMLVNYNVKEYNDVKGIEDKDCGELYIFTTTEITPKSQEQPDAQQQQHQQLAPAYNTSYWSYKLNPKNKKKKTEQDVLPSPIVISYYDLESYCYNHFVIDILLYIRIYFERPHVWEDIGWYMMKLTHLSQFCYEKNVDDGVINGNTHRTLPLTFDLGNVDEYPSYYTDVLTYQQNVLLKSASKQKISGGSSKQPMTAQHVVYNHHLTCLFYKEKTKIFNTTDSKQNKLNKKKLNYINTAFFCEAVTLYINIIMYLTNLYYIINYEELIVTKQYITEKQNEIEAKQDAEKTAVVPVKQAPPPAKKGPAAKGGKAGAVASSPEPDNNKDIIKEPIITLIDDDYAIIAQRQKERLNDLYDALLHPDFVTFPLLILPLQDNTNNNEQEIGQQFSNPQSSNNVNKENVPIVNITSNIAMSVEECNATQNKRTSSLQYECLQSYINTLTISFALLFSPQIIMHPIDLATNVVKPYYNESVDTLILDQNDDKKKQDVTSHFTTEPLVNNQQAVIYNPRRVYHYLQGYPVALQIIQIVYELTRFETFTKKVKLQQQLARYNATRNHLELDPPQSFIATGGEIDELPAALGVLGVYILLNITNWMSIIFPQQHTSAIYKPIAHGNPDNAGFMYNEQQCDVLDIILESKLVPYDLSVELLNNKNSNANFTLFNQQEQPIIDPTTGNALNLEQLVKNVLTQQEQENNVNNATQTTTTSTTNIATTTSPGSITKFINKNQINIYNIKTNITFIAICFLLFLTSTFKYEIQTQILALKIFSSSLGSGSAGNSGSPFFNIMQCYRIFQQMSIKQIQLDTLMPILWPSLNGCGSLYQYDIKLNTIITKYVVEFYDNFIRNDVEQYENSFKDGNTSFCNNMQHLGYRLLLNNTYLNSFFTLQQNESCFVQKVKMNNNLLIIDSATINEDFDIIKQTKENNNGDDNEDGDIYDMLGQINNKKDEPIIVDKNKKQPNNNNNNKNAKSNVVVETNKQNTITNDTTLPIHYQHLALINNKDNLLPYALTQSDEAAAAAKSTNILLNNNYNSAFAINNTLQTSFKTLFNTCNLYKAKYLPTELNIAYDFIEDDEQELTENNITIQSTQQQQNKNIKNLKNNHDFNIVIHNPQNFRNLVLFSSNRHTNVDYIGSLKPPLLPPSDGLYVNPYSEVLNNQNYNNVITVDEVKEKQNNKTHDSDDEDVVGEVVFTANTLYTTQIVGNNIDYDQVIANNKDKLNNNKNDYKNALLLYKNHYEANTYIAMPSLLYSPAQSYQTELFGGVHGGAIQSGISTHKNKSEEKTTQQNNNNIIPFSTTLVHMDTKTSNTLINQYTHTTDENNIIVKFKCLYNILLYITTALHHFEDDDVKFGVEDNKKKPYKNKLDIELFQKWLNVTPQYDELEIEVEVTETIEETTKPAANAKKGAVAQPAATAKTTKTVKKIEKKKVLSTKPPMLSLFPYVKDYVGTIEQYYNYVEVAAGIKSYNGQQNSQYNYFDKKDDDKTHNIADINITPTMALQKLTIDIEKRMLYISAEIFNFFCAKVQRQYNNYMQKRYKDDQQLKKKYGQTTDAEFELPTSPFDEDSSSDYYFTDYLIIVNYYQEITLLLQLLQNNCTTILQVYTKDTINQQQQKEQSNQSVALQHSTLQSINTLFLLVQSHYNTFIRIIQLFVQYSAIPIMLIHQYLEPKQLHAMITYKKQHAIENNNKDNKNEPDDIMNNKDQQKDNTPESVNDTTEVFLSKTMGRLYTNTKLFDQQQYKQQQQNNTTNPVLLATQSKLDLMNQCGLPAIISMFYSYQIWYNAQMDLLLRKTTDFIQFYEKTTELTTKIDNLLDTNNQDNNHNNSSPENMYYTQYLQQFSQELMQLTLQAPGVGATNNNGALVGSVANNAQLLLQKIESLINEQQSNQIDQSNNNNNNVVINTGNIVQQHILKSANIFNTLVSTHIPSFYDYDCYKSTSNNGDADTNTQTTTQDKAYLICRNIKNNTTLTILPLIIQKQQKALYHSTMWNSFVLFDNLMYIMRNIYIGQYIPYNFNLNSHYAANNMLDNKSAVPAADKSKATTAQPAAAATTAKKPAAAPAKVPAALLAKQQAAQKAKAAAAPPAKTTAPANNTKDNKKAQPKQPTPAQQQYPFDVPQLLSGDNTQDNTEKKKLEEEEQNVDVVLNKLQQDIQSFLLRYEERRAPPQDPAATPSTTASNKNKNNTKDDDKQVDLFNTLKSIQNHLQNERKDILKQNIITTGDITKSGDAEATLSNVLEQKEQYIRSIKEYLLNTMIPIQQEHQLHEDVVDDDQDGNMTNFDVKTVIAKLDALLTQQEIQPVGNTVDNTKTTGNTKTTPTFIDTFVNNSVDNTITEID